ncbi:MAG: hypothetical protein AAGB12_10255 [Pseudomonadota bacterium]
MKYLYLTTMSLAACYVNQASAQALCDNQTQAPWQYTIDITHEEQRIDQAKITIPSTVEKHQVLVDSFINNIKPVTNDEEILHHLVKDYAQQLWNQAVAQVNDTYDDRPLYWSRIAMSIALKNHLANHFAGLEASTTHALLWSLETHSRGMSDEETHFNPASAKKVVITGFDPFYFDNNIGTSNPSGAAAIQLDDKVIDGVEFQTVVLPVRFKDFSMSMVEHALSRFYTPTHDNPADVIFTTSLGGSRNTFLLERFAGLRRSSTAADNQGCFSGGSFFNPIIPYIPYSPTFEFLESSLPIAAIEPHQGQYQVDFNQSFVTIDGGANDTTGEAVKLEDIINEISVSGSGGGYLSNEVSYRSLWLKEYLGSAVSVGHIHTPILTTTEIAPDFSSITTQISPYNLNFNEGLVNQLEAMIVEGVAD